MSPEAEAILKLLQGRCHQWGLAPTKDLIFSQELRQACVQNTCGRYGASWTCPPAVGSIDSLKERILAFPQGLVFTTMLELEDSFDFPGMQRAKEIHDAITAEVHDRFGERHPVFGAGSCTRCSPCAYPQSCRFPGQTYPSLEAAGIHVTELSVAAGVLYNNGPNTVTYFSMVLVP
ncbi:MAG: DUF2284 domain-containing protein [Treponema sp.]|nr:DUF2284 domain-containing protein [Treponema sp.]